MKTSNWELITYYDALREEFHCSEMDGMYYSGYTTLPIDHLLPNVCGKDLFYDVTLKELFKYKEVVLEGKIVAIEVEVDIEDDSSNIIACRIMKVKVRGKGDEI